jgi:hypothetical protein
MRNTRELTTWHLATMADCGAPDRSDGIGCEPPMVSPDPSAGAIFLRSVADRWQEYRDYGDGLPDSDACAEIADGAPDICTATRWREFVDLAAWDEDPTELGFEGSDMLQGAAICLYMVAERLCSALNTWAEDGEA